MNKIKNSTVSFFGIVTLIFLATACENSRKYPADDILNRVSERYANLTQFEINATFTSEITAGLNVEKQDYSVYYAVMQPGNIHLEVSGRSSGITLVSDGNITWTYLPGQNQYRADRSSPLYAVSRSVNVAGLSGNFIELGEQLAGAFKYINVGLETATVIDETTIRVNRVPRDAYVIEAVYSGQNLPGDTRIERSPVTYWVDKQNYLVLRKKVEVSIPDPTTGKYVRKSQTVELEKFTFDPELPESFFTFRPPEGAEKVETLKLEQDSPKIGLVGKPAIYFEKETLDGETLTLDRLKGNVVLLDFWASWCGPCREAHPGLERLHRGLKDRGLVVLGVNSEPEERIRKYMTKYDYTFTNLLDKNEEMARKYRVSAIPSLYIIDREGTISAHLVGYKTEQEIREAVNEAGL